MRQIRFVRGMVVALACGVVGSGWGQSQWTSGHGDIGVGYEDEGDGFEFHPHWHIEGGTVDGVPRGDEEFEAGDLILVVPDIPGTKATRNANSTWNPIGVGAGDSYWRISSSPIPDVPYLGWATEELDVNDWTGNITFTLSGLEGPGDISLYYFPDGELTFLWASSDGLSPADSFGLEPGVHQHFNMAFTQPGLYEAQITVAGIHKVDGFQSMTETFAFNVVPEPSTGLLGVGALALLLLRRRRSK